MIYKDGFNTVSGTPQSIRLSLSTISCFNKLFQSWTIKPITMNPHSLNSTCSTPSCLSLGKEGLNQVSSVIKSRWLCMHVATYIKLNFMATKFPIGLIFRMHEYYFTNLQKYYYNLISADYISLNNLNLNSCRELKVWWYAKTLLYGSKSKFLLWKCGCNGKQDVHSLWRS